MTFLFKRVISMNEVAEQIRTAISMINGVTVFEETLALDGQYATWIISFEVPNKGYWIAHAKLDDILESRAHILLYQLKSRIEFSAMQTKAAAQKQDFQSTLFEACEESPDFIQAYTNAFTCFELPFFINNVHNI